MIWKKLNLTPRFNSIARFVSFFFSIVLVVFYCGSSASAIQFGQGSALVLKNGTIQSWPGTIINGVKNGEDLVFPLPADQITLKNMYFEYEAGSGTQADYVYSFNVRYESVSAQNGYLVIDGLLSHTQDVLTTSCVEAENNPVYTQGGVLVYQGNVTITCTYWVYSHGNYSSFSSRQGSRIATIYSQVNQSSALIVSPGTLRHFNTNALSEDDRTWLEEHIGSSDSTAVVNKLNELLAAQNTTNSSINNLRSDVQSQTQQQHADYENEVQREEDKQDELEDQSEDVSISANAVANPFASLFNSANCASFPTLASWLNVDPTKIQVCSPYPQQFRPIIEFVSSAIVVGLLIRVYYKQLRGGYAS